MACTAQANGSVKNLKKGTTIITAEPFVFILGSLHRKERCDYCFNSGKISRCSGCQFVYYCSKNCQKKGWLIHKVECPSIKRVSPRIVPDAARMLARIIIKLNQGAKNERGYYTDTKYRTFNDLMSHEESIKKNIKKMEHFTSLSMVLLEFLPKKIIPEPRELLRIFGRMSVNSFNILDTDMTSLGVGIYLGPSILDHSCKPNATAIFEGTKLLIRTLCDLESLDWSKIFITYIDLLKDTKTRREELNQSYFFWCECERCNTPETIEISAACPNKKCTNPCSSMLDKCDKCGEKITDEFVDKFNEVCELSLYQLDKMQSTAYLDASRMCLEKQDGVVHPYNLIAVRTLENAVAAAVDLERWKEAEIYVSKLILKYLYYYGNSHPMTAQMYFSWGKLLSLQKKGFQALEVVTKAARMIEQTFGANHSKVKDEVKPVLDQLVAEYRMSNGCF
ncbi:SET and MYND domain containing, class 3 [Cotesia typhae]|uniref:SET and MYND domain containing, class 3 n=1 Tax=Cotesia typhae TaxID=2053667 RepID=UPI003D691412